LRNVAGTAKAVNDLASCVDMSCRRCIVCRLQSGTGRWNCDVT
jgi:hypothetical protein